jgi:hypothetical protein
MNRFAIALMSCASVFLPAESAERLTRECNTNFGNLYAQMQARRWIGEGITLCLDSRP